MTEEIIDEDYHWKIIIDSVNTALTEVGVLF